MKAIKPLVMVLPDMVDAKTLARLAKAGYVVVEVKDFAGMKVVTPPPIVPLEGLAAIALEVLCDEKVDAFSLRDTFRKRALTAARDQMKSGK